MNKIENLNAKLHVFESPFEMNNFYRHKQLKKPPIQTSLNRCVVMFAFRDVRSRICNDCTLPLLLMMMRAREPNRITRPRNQISTLIFHESV